MRERFAFASSMVCYCTAARERVFLGRGGKVGGGGRVNEHFGKDNSMRIRPAPLPVCAVDLELEKYFVV